ncbi:MAG TPA: sigma-70 family RNA polymerase sigma factor [Polyangiales bacterium]|nr:sigma-70 family RNA polymerase sigma factor [Polyangiales bacterium]
MNQTRPNTFCADALWRTAHSTPLLTVEAEERLARDAKGGSTAAFEALLRAHLRLVLAMARGYAKYGLPSEDLVSEGLLGLVEAARRFDPERGVRLSTYAVWWIREYMRRYTMLNRRIIRTPSSRHGRKLLAKLRDTQRRMTQEAGEPPDAAAVAKELGVGVSDVEEVDAALSGRDIPCGTDPDQEGMIEVQSDNPTPEALYSEAEASACSQDAVRDAIDRLNPRERKILEQRYLSPNMSSLSSIGDALGISRERVRQIEHRACAKIREAVLPSLA